MPTAVNAPGRTVGGAAVHQLETGHGHVDLPVEGKVPLKQAAADQLGLPLSV